MPGRRGHRGAALLESSMAHQSGRCFVGDLARTGAAHGLPAGDEKGGEQSFHAATSGEAGTKTGKKAAPRPADLNRESDHERLCRSRTDRKSVGQGTSVDL